MNHDFYKIITHDNWKEKGSFSVDTYCETSTKHAMGYVLFERFTHSQIKVTIKDGHYVAATNCQILINDFNGILDFEFKDDFLIDVFFENKMIYRFSSERKVKDVSDLMMSNTFIFFLIYKIFVDRNDYKRLKDLETFNLSVITYCYLQEKFPKTFLDSLFKEDKNHFNMSYLLQLESENKVGYFIQNEKLLCYELFLSFFEYDKRGGFHHYKEYSYKQENDDNKFKIDDLLELLLKEEKEFNLYKKLYLDFINRYLNTSKKLNIN